MVCENGYKTFTHKSFFLKFLILPLFFSEPLEVTVESGGNFEDYVRFLSCHVLGPVNHGQNWKGWESSDICKNQPKRLDFDIDSKSCITPTLTYKSSL